MQKKLSLPIALALLFCIESVYGIDLFAKGSASKTYISRDKYTLSVSATTGLAITLFSGFRIEGRYTNVSSLQNKVDVPQLGATLHDMLTETSIYSAGLDISFASDKASVQPFIYLGAGYIESVRKYYVSTAADPTLILQTEPQQVGISGNLGAGLRIRVGNSAAIELELYSYATDVDKPDPLFNLYATAGLRLYM